MADIPRMMCAMHEIWQIQRRKLASGVECGKSHIRRVAATTEAKRKELACLIIKMEIAMEQSPRKGGKRMINKVQSIQDETGFCSDKEIASRLERDLALIKKGVLELIGEEELKEKLIRYYRTNKPLVIKLGLDPSAPDVHLGHTVVLRKIRQFQSLGHKAMIIIGDFTGRIGDPTGKSKTRKQLTEREVLDNADTYHKQLLKILDPEKTIICFNSEWLDQISLKHMIELMSKQSLARILERDGFKKRMETNETIFLHELLYPMLQGMDSLEIEADVELGGMDQKFNILMGRDMQLKEGMEKQAALFMPILEGIDGIEKMSKSLNNYIGINEPADVIFEKMMSIPDQLIHRYYTLLTDKHPDEISQIMDKMESYALHPKEVKLALSEEITRLFSTEEESQKAKERFIRVFSQDLLPQNAEVINVKEGQTLVEILVNGKLAKSNSEARRLIQQNGIKINKTVINDLDYITFSNKDILQVGKRKFRQIEKS